MEKDYGKTLNLPSTEFPMRANLPSREPETLKKWEDMDLYGMMLKKNEGNTPFILHDGPPYANGDIHLGHALNKILKDIVLKSKTMQGYYTPYTPGWDTHGLPIERQAIKKLGIDKSQLEPVKFRGVCKDFALKYVDNQREQFKRLGVTADWDKPYLTLLPEYEGKQIEVFGEMVKKGYIYRGLKPVYWCTDCETALAEAEIEYQECTTNSIYVKFPVKDSHGRFDAYSNVYFVIWTTTTWTLPGNVAISVHPRCEYSLVKVGDEIYVLATELIESTAKAAGFSEYEILESFPGSELEKMTCYHPFIDRESLIITGEHVTMDAGTGCVHTAPGHGAEDYVACLDYDLPIIVPVDDKGYLNEQAGKFEGLFYEKSNEPIIEELKERKLLLAIEPIAHTYPHCWRCHQPIVFRATDQWFASVEGFKEDALRAIKEVEWLPAWGEDRISSMVADRSDWCISRQRMWGVPIPIFFCEDCKKPLIREDAIDHVAKIFSEHGSNAWYTMSAEELLPEGTACECGCHSFRKETDTMDVWFDSGSSHAAVLDDTPCDMYLEGNDQYRGWFQSSLLTSAVCSGKAPYKMVLTHGFVIDEEKQKMSKSLGNGIAPADIIKEYGADILRLWVASADYKVDIKMSRDLLKQLSEGYRKIRNTARYILGSNSDFNPDTDMVTSFEEIDRYILMKLNRLIERVRQGYNRYDFHVVYHAVHNFCVVDLSNFYLDVIKDRTYCNGKEDPARRSAQSAMYLVLSALTRLLAPILTYTMEEIWGFMAHPAGESAESVFLTNMPEPDSSFEDEALAAKWDTLLALKTDVAKALENARAEKKIGKSLDAKILLYADGNSLSFLEENAALLAEVFITSQVEILDADKAAEDAVSCESLSGTKAAVTVAEGKRCDRCWSYHIEVDEEGLCPRCHSVMQ